MSSAVFSFDSSMGESWVPKSQSPKSDSTTLPSLSESMAVNKTLMEASVHSAAEPARPRIKAPSSTKSIMPSPSLSYFLKASRGPTNLPHLPTATVLRLLGGLQDMLDPFVAWIGVLLLKSRKDFAKAASNATSVPRLHQAPASGCRGSAALSQGSCCKSTSHVILRALWLCALAFHCTSRSKSLVSMIFT